MLAQAPAQAAEDTLGPCLWGLMKPETAEALLAETDYERAGIMFVLAQGDDTDVGLWGCGMPPVVQPTAEQPMPPAILARTAYFSQLWSERRLARRWSPDRLAAAFATVPESQLVEAYFDRLQPDGPTPGQLAIYTRFLSALNTTTKDRDGGPLTTYFLARASRHWAAGKLEAGVTDFTAPAQKEKKKSFEVFPGMKRIIVPPRQKAIQRQQR